LGTNWNITEKYYCWLYLKKNNLI